MAFQDQDPLATLGTPATSTSPDPLASLGVPAAESVPAPKAAPVPEPSIYPAVKSSNIPTFGYEGQPPEQRLTMPLVKVLIPVLDVLQKAQSVTPGGRADHPIMSKIGDLANNLEELLTGGQSAGKPLGTRSGVLNNPISALILPGGEAAEAMQAEPATSAVLRQASSAADAVPGAVRAGEDLAGAAIQKMNPFRAKALATKAVDDAAASVAVDSRLGAGIAPPSQVGMRTALDAHISQIATRERALYDQLSEVSGTDMKDLYEKRETLQEALDDPTTSNTDQLQDRLRNIEGQIAVGEKNARAAGVKAEDLLTTAKADTQQRYAIQELKKQIFNNESVVSGNLAAGTDERINIDAAIKNAEKLDKPSRFAPQGSPSRLEQALGNEGAANFKRALYAAQKRGAVDVRLTNLAKWAVRGAAGAAGYEAIKHLAP